MRYIPPILITGSARSGTSLVGGIFSRLGVYGGKMKIGNRWNPKGYFENTHLRDKVMKPYLEDCGLDIRMQASIPDRKNIKSFRHLKMIFISSLYEQGYLGGHWFYKHAGLALTWPLFHVHFPEASWIFVKRDIPSIVKSLMATAFMRAFKTEAEWEMWVGEFYKSLEEMQEAGLDVRTIEVNKIIAGDLSEVQNASEEIGIVWSKDKLRRIQEFIEPELWHGEKQ